ncbi:MAG TPA: bifunctional riboflavin kinase/FAD synthetase [bacterium]|nr:bifunctional riboflavin kinase/FAD synthetase [Candidatus Omnitrophota bacterium]HOJ58766.1 bifunctional riboflavin kinase/FAD synthetase [bacterium]HOL93956.1 bifunctional riboflavin kinase/FAD synthetase [bacterium]HPO99208.1 bifunctional riboflavin kinase/FAD synthetase [bacterium]HXK93353.1 bifunctional riboflavin kinase/FAD synthetase [bacterium]
MIEILSLNECAFRLEDNLVVALGFFDGLHLAHQRLITEAKRRAHARGGWLTVFTFQNHPSQVLNPGTPVPLLSPYPLKRELLKAMEVDAVVAVPFDWALCHTSAEAFIDTVLRGRLHAREVVIGFNFRFGHQRRGSAEMLKQRVPEAFEAVTIIEQQFHDDIPISSSAIRELVQNGHLLEAEALLGRPYPVAGLVVRGDGRGRALGVPTANLAIDNQVLPPNGVYGVRVYIGGLGNQTKWGVMNIGNVPTFKNETIRHAEAHILDFDQNIYDQYLIAEIIHPLREERKFPGPVELIRQIHADIEAFQDWVSQSSGMR